MFGPFVILLLFGIGYDNQPPALRTLFVGPPGTRLRAGRRPSTPASWRTGSSRQGFTSDEAAAEARPEPRTTSTSSWCSRPTRWPAVLARRAGRRSAWSTTSSTPSSRPPSSFATQLAVDKVNSAILAQIVGAGQDADPAPRRRCRAALTRLGQQLGTVAARAPTRRHARAAGRRAAPSAAAASSMLVGDAHGLVLASVRGRARPATSSASSTRPTPRSPICRWRGPPDVAAATGPDRQATADASTTRRRAARRRALASCRPSIPPCWSQPFIGETEVAVAEPVGITDFYAPARHRAADPAPRRDLRCPVVRARPRPRPVRDAARRPGHRRPRPCSASTAPTASIGAVVAAALTALVVTGSERPDGRPGLLGRRCPRASCCVASLGLGFVVSLIARSRTAKRSSSR